MEREKRDYDRDTLYRTPRAWFNAKKGFGLQTDIVKMMLAMEKLCDKGPILCPRHMLCIALYAYVSAGNEGRAEMAQRYYAWSNSERIDNPDNSDRPIIDGGEYAYAWPRMGSAMTLDRQLIEGFDIAGERWRLRFTHRKIKDSTGEPCCTKINKNRRMILVAAEFRGTQILPHLVASVVAELCAEAATPGALMPEQLPKNDTDAHAADFHDAMRKLFGADASNE